MAPNAHQVPGLLWMRVLLGFIAGTLTHLVVETKVCSQCGEVKEAKMFHKATITSDGLRSRCKVCQAAFRIAQKTADPLRHALLHRNAHHRRRARQRQNGGSGYTQAQLQLQLEKQGPICPYCSSYRPVEKPHRLSLRKRDSYHIDHVVPISKGGPHSITNVILCCPECNLKKHAAPAPIPVQILMPFQVLEPVR